MFVTHAVLDGLYTSSEARMNSVLHVLHCQRDVLLPVTGLCSFVGSQRIQVPNLYSLLPISNPPLYVRREACCKYYDHSALFEIYVQHPRRQEEIGV